MRKALRTWGLTALVALALISPLHHTVVAQDNWVKKADTPKAGGLGEAVVSTGDHAYILRCYSTGNCQFWWYDPADDSWITLLDWAPPDPIPRPKNGTALAWDGGDYIYALLGAAYDENRTYFYRYSISKGSWERLPDTPHSQGAGDAIAWSGYDRRIYAFLGSARHGTAFARYNPDTKSWETLPSPWGVTDDGASLVWAGGEHLYALRGEWEEETPHNDFARYNVRTGSWETMAPIPENECDASNHGGGCGVGDGASLLWVSAYPDYIFAFGGGGVLEDPGYNFYRYAIAWNQWEKLAPIPCPVGYWNGNRLGFVSGRIHYWQGAPSTWICSGSAFYMFDSSPPLLERRVYLPLVSKNFAR
jgi:hypothetical protein